MIRAVLLIGLTIAPTAAFADRAAADACAASLPAEARLIYDAAIPALTPGADVRAVMTDKTKGLVQAGKVASGSARDSAVAAGQCVQKLR